MKWWSKPATGYWLSFNPKPHSCNLPMNHGNAGAGSVWVCAECRSIWEIVNNGLGPVWRRTARRLCEMA